MASLHESVTHIARTLVAGLTAPPVAGLEPGSIRVEIDPAIWAGSVKFRLSGLAWDVGFCLHPHDYPSTFTLNGESRPDWPLNNDAEIAQSLKKIVALIRDFVPGTN